jgi:hypothetical protein
MVFRQVGQVRKCFPNSGWLARFQFRVDEKMSVLHGPSRASKDEAEADRRAVAASMAQASGPSRVDIASRVLQSLKDRGALSCSDDIGTSSVSLEGNGAGNCSNEPGTASLVPVPDAKILRQMHKKELRELATRTAGVQRDKKNSKGKWVPKTCKEIVTSLLAMGANIQTQALPGSNLQSKNPCGARFRAGAVKKRPAAAVKHCASTVKRRPASICAAS